jgi:hypothetical protein
MMRCQRYHRQRYVRLSALIWLGAVASLDAAGAAGEPAAAFKDGDWVRNGATFICEATPADTIPPDKSNSTDLARACLHMGPFRVGNPAQTLKAVLGEPHKTLPQPGGMTAWLYFLDQREQFPYLVAFVLQDRILALQTNGTAPANGYSFNHVDLGADTDTLIRVFGPALQTQPSGIKDTDLWIYGFFSFEVKDGHVTSIQLNDPAFQGGP